MRFVQWLFCAAWVARLSWAALELQSAEFAHGFTILLLRFNTKVGLQTENVPM